jgi:hypothetical protein
MNQHQINQQRMTQTEIQTIENGVQGDMHMYGNVLRCPHPVLITDMRTGSY